MEQDPLEKNKGQKKQSKKERLKQRRKEREEQNKITPSVSEEPKKPESKPLKEDKKEAQISQPPKKWGVIRQIKEAIQSKRERDRERDTRKKITESWREIDQKYAGAETATIQQLKDELDLLEAELNKRNEGLLKKILPEVKRGQLKRKIEELKRRILEREEYTKKRRQLESGFSETKRGIQIPTHEVTPPPLPPFKEIDPFGQRGEWPVPEIPKLTEPTPPPLLESALKPIIHSIDMRTTTETLSHSDPKPEYPSTIKPISPRDSGLEPISQINPLDQIVIGSKILYKGIQYTIIEIPSENNGNVYILTGKTALPFKRNAEDVRKALQLKEATLIQPEPTTQESVPPVVPESILLSTPEKKLKQENREEALAQLRTVITQASQELSKINKELEEIRARRRLKKEKLKKWKS
jgi:hypothetical protein